MLRIRINWDYISPFLRVVRGKLIVEDINNLHQSVEVIMKCDVEKKEGSISFSSIKNPPDFIPAKLFELLRDEIYNMVYSYFEGMQLNKEQYHWVSDTLNISANEWTKKRINYLKEVKHEYGMELVRKEKEKQNNKLYKQKSKSIYK